MNERIRELALQAGYKPLSPPTFADELNEIFMQKFAKSIVLECADIATYHFRRTFEDGSKAIKEHFGVKE